MATTNERQPRVDITRMLNLGLEKNEPYSSDFNPLEAIGRMSNEDKEWMSLAHIDQRKLEVTKGIIMLWMDASAGWIDLPKIIWYDFLMTRSVNGRAMKSLEAMQIAEVNRKTDEASGWTRMVKRDNNRPTQE